MRLCEKGPLLFQRVGGQVVTFHVVEMHMRTCLDGPRGRSDRLPYLKIFSPTAIGRRATL